MESSMNTCTNRDWTRMPTLNHQPSTLKFSGIDRLGTIGATAVGIVAGNQLYCFAFGIWHLLVCAVCRLQNAESSSKSITVGSMQFQREDEGTNT